jgi:N-acetylglutamate synthase-like GNAT family acetyltransferase
MPLEIRAAQLSDAPGVGPLLLQLGYEGDPEIVRRRLDRVMGRQDNVVYVAVDRPYGLVGLIHAGVQVTLLERPFAEIGAMVVTAEQRSNGIGRALLDKVHIWAIKRGLEEVVIRSQTHRQSAHTFFENLGYVKVKDQRVLLRNMADPRRTGDSTLMD